MKETVIQRIKKRTWTPFFALWLQSDGNAPKI